MKELHRQYAALPFVEVAGAVEVCLVTSRETKRWIVPKGWPKAGLTPHELAAREVEEEAGLTGEVGERPIGHYLYRKRLHFFSRVTCRVEVYPLRVTCQLLDWPELSWRQRVWVNPAEAASMVDDEGLAELIRDFDQRSGDFAGSGAGGNRHGSATPDH